MGTKLTAEDTSRLLRITFDAPEPPQRFLDFDPARHVGTMLYYPGMAICRISEQTSHYLGVNAAMMYEVYSSACASGYYWVHHPYPGSNNITFDRCCTELSQLDSGEMGVTPLPVAFLLSAFGLLASRGKRERVRTLQQVGSTAHVGMSVINKRTTMFHAVEDSVSDANVFTSGCIKLT